MRVTIKAVAALVIGLGAATPGLAADGLSFQSVEPEGLSEDAMLAVTSVQGVMPAQMPAYEQQGFSYYGAFAVPKGQELGLSAAEMAKWLVIKANTETLEEAKTGVLESCVELTNAEDCTLIGLMVPAE
ncbi:MAG: hypothetical protein P8X76_06595 [Maritimibacter sp.]